MAENVIFISSHEVQLINGSCDKSDMVKVHNYESFKLEDGAMLNGVIIDETPILEILKNVRAKGISSCLLVIDSGQVLTKNLEVPIVRAKELITITKNELADIDGSYEDLVYDYCVLKNNHDDKERAGGEILCCALERKLVGSYIDLFASADIKLKSIDISINALHKLTQEVAELNNKTYTVSVLDANNVSSFLFENNHYTFSNRTRLFSERGTEEFIAEMNSNISQLVQFSKSKQSPYTIETAFFCGLDKEEMQIFSSIKENLGINAELFPNSGIVYVTNRNNPKEFQLHEYVFMVGSLIRK